MRSKDLLKYVESFKTDPENPMDKNHPAHLVMDVLSGKVADTNTLHAKQLEQWYKDYATMRRAPHLFRSNVAPCHLRVHSPQISGSG